MPTRPETNEFAVHQMLRLKSTAKHFPVLANLALWQRSCKLQACKMTPQYALDSRLRLSDEEGKHFCISASFQNATHHQFGAAGAPAACLGCGSPAHPAPLGQA
eukprot:1143298-Pelagomonas_calceolata.AAC.7